MSYFRPALRTYGIAPKRVYRLQTTFMGDDSAPAGNTPAVVNIPSPPIRAVLTTELSPDFQTSILASIKNIEAHTLERIRKEEVRGWVQLAATLSIPIAAAIWRRLGFIKSKSST